MPFDPINDQEKPFTLDEFLDVAKEELTNYVEVWRNKNEFTKGAHTWKDWWNHFHRFMSW